MLRIDRLPILMQSTCAEANRGNGKYTKIELRNTSKILVVLDSTLSEPHTTQRYLQIDQHCMRFTTVSCASKLAFKNLLRRSPVDLHRLNLRHLASVRFTGLATVLVVSILRRSYFDDVNRHKRDIF